MDAAAAGINCEMVKCEDGRDALARVSVVETTIPAGDDEEGWPQRVRCARPPLLISPCLCQNDSVSHCCKAISDLIEVAARAQRAHKQHDAVPAGVLLCLSSKCSSTPGDGEKWPEEAGVLR